MKVLRAGELPVSILLQASAVLCLAMIMLVVVVLFGCSPAAAMLVSLLALSYMNYYIGGRDVLYPGFMFCTIWTLVSAIYVACPIEIHPLGWNSVAVFVGGGAFFSVGSAIGNSCYRSGEDSRFQVHVPDSQGRLILLAYSIIMAPLFVHDTTRLVGTFSLSPAYFIATRAMIIRSFQNGVLPYSNRFVSTAPMIAILTAWVFAMEEKRKLLVVIAIGVAVVLCIFTTGRMMLMQLVCGLVMIAMLRINDRSFKRTIKVLIPGALVIVFVLSALTMLLKSETQGVDGVAVSSKMTVMYIAGPLAAFDQAVRDPRMLRAQGNITFADVLLPLSRHGLLRYTPRPLFQEFVFVPFPANVYTAYKPYYIDFGMVGCFVAFLLFGFFHEYLLRASTNGSSIAILLTAYLSYALIFSPFDDSYHLLTRYIYVLTFIALYFGVLKKLPTLIFNKIPS